MQNKKVWIIVGALVVLVAIAAAVFLKGDGESGGVDQAQISDFAKSIDHTKSSSPSVPPERLKLGVTGKRPAPGR